MPSGRKIAFVGGLAATEAVLFGFGTAAWAYGEAWSPVASYSDNGVNYQNEATIFTHCCDTPPTTGRAYADVTVSPRNKDVDPGWVGTLSQLIRNGSVVNQYGYRFNSIPLSAGTWWGGGSAFGVTGNTNSNTYNARGVTKAYNPNSSSGDKMDAFWSFTSPPQNG